MSTRLTSSSPASAGPKGVLVVSDLHVGSIYGMLPPDYEAEDGTRVGQNPGQRYLWDCWLHLCETVKKMNIVAVVINGDLIDGGQHMQKGTELCLPRLGDQAEASACVLRPLRKNTAQSKWYAVKGTEYHDSKGGEKADHVAEKLNCERYKGAGPGRFAREVLDLSVDGTIINFSHGISVSGGLYRATAADREGVWSALAGKDGKLPKAHVVVRSHAHYFVRVEHESKHILITPCWELQTSYMRKNSVYRMLPTIGAVILWIDQTATDRGMDPMHLQKIIYALPKTGVTVL